MSFAQKRNNVDKFINLRTKAEERSMIQNSFRTQDPNIKKGTIRNQRQNSQLIYNPLCFQNPWIHSIYSKNPQSMCLLIKAKSVDTKPTHPILST